MAISTFYKSEPGTTEVEQITEAEALRLAEACEAVHVIEVTLAPTGSVTARFDGAQEGPFFVTLPRGFDTKDAAKALAAVFAALPN